MKKMVLLLLAGVALFAFILATSMLWYKFFYGSPDVINNVNSVKVQLDDTNNTIDESGLIPLSDDMAMSLTPYEFKVENTGDTAVTYNVLLEDNIVNDDSTYNNKKLLSRNQLRYQLLLNGKIIKVGNLNKIKNNVLDTRNIASDQVNNYQLRIYVSEDAQDTSWQDKYYHFEISVQMEEEDI